VLTGRAELSMPRRVLYVEAQPAFQKRGLDAGRRWVMPKMIGAPPPITLGADFGRPVMRDFFGSGWRGRRAASSFSAEARM